MGTQMKPNPGCITTSTSCKCIAIAMPFMAMFAVFITVGLISCISMAEPGSGTVVSADLESIQGIKVGVDFDLGRGIQAWSKWLTENIGIFFLLSAILTLVGELALYCWWNKHKSQQTEGDTILIDPDQENDTGIEMDETVSTQQTLLDRIQQTNMEKYERLKTLEVQIDQLVNRDGEKTPREMNDIENLLAQTAEIKIPENFRPQVRVATRRRLEASLEQPSTPLFLPCLLLLPLGYLAYRFFRTYQRRKADADPMRYHYSYSRRPTDIMLGFTAP